jgi:ABC-type oligopeptide transport system ATPase subunit
VTGALAQVEGAIMATIEFQHVTRIYPDAATPAVDDVSFTVPEGALCMLVGTSGSGKTRTLSRCVVASATSFSR